MVDAALADAAEQVMRSGQAHVASLKMVTDDFGPFGAALSQKIRETVLFAEDAPSKRLFSVTCEGICELVITYSVMQITLVANTRFVQYRACRRRDRMTRAAGHLYIAFTLLLT
jgi:hypothetical protein